ncbi:MAG: SDR family NAD(P)-dependent oxidoreductase [Streptosporangiaceae bacterium]
MIFSLGGEPVKDRLSVVSGGGTGIGKAVARELAARGDRVVIVGRRMETLEMAAKEIRSCVEAAEIVPVAADLTDPSPRTQGEPCRSCLARSRRCRRRGRGSSRTRGRTLG